MLRELILGGLITLQAIVIANNVPEQKNPVPVRPVAVVSQKDAVCYKIQGSEQQMCYKVELPKEEPTPIAEVTTPKETPKPNIGQGVEQWRELVAKYFPSSEVDKALLVMKGESGGNPEAIGDTNTEYCSVGLFQIRTLPGRPSIEELKNPEFNISYAAQMQSAQGWRPWTVARRLGF